MTKPEQSIAHGLDCLRRLASEALERTPEGQRSAFAETLLNQRTRLRRAWRRRRDRFPPLKKLALGAKVGSWRRANDK